MGLRKENLTGSVFELTTSWNVGASYQLGYFFFYVGGLPYFVNIFVLTGPLNKVVDKIGRLPTSAELVEHQPISGFIGSNPAQVNLSYFNPKFVLSVFPCGRLLDEISLSDRIVSCSWFTISVLICLFHRALPS